MDLRYPAMFRILQLGFSFLFVVATVIPGITAQNMSINELILNAGGLDSLDVFHVLDSDVVGVKHEFDLMIPLVQYSEMMAAANSSRKKKSINKHKRWPNDTISYEIMESIRPNATSIRSALDLLSEYTCLTFVETEDFLPRMQYKSDRRGCWAVIGNTGSTNVINLGSPMCIKPATIHHETFHSLGIYHEHNRPDRDKYVYIKPEAKSNIDWGMVLNKSNVQSFGIEYDYRSIMHYNIWHSKGYVKDPYYQNKTGRYTFTSFRDLKLLNAAFGCSDKYCSGPEYEQSCPFDGFRVTKKLNGEPKCQCWCHSGSLTNEDQFALCSSLNISMEPVYDLPHENSTLDKESCTDLLDNCTSLKEKRFCFTHLVKMKKLCPKTCNFCGKGEDFCIDHDESCTLMAEFGVCKDKGLEQFMSNLCPKSCGQCTQNHSACDIEEAMKEPEFINSAAINSQLMSLLTAFFVLLDRVNN